MVATAPNATAAAPATTLDALVIACRDCTFTPLRALTLNFPPACQSFRITVAAVSAEGVVTRSFFAAAGVAVRSTPDEPVLVLVDTVIESALEVYNGARRGYRVGAASVARNDIASPSRIAVRLLLAQSTFYVDVALEPVQSATQLASSLVTLLGLVGAYTVLFAVGEDWWRRARARDSHWQRRSCCCAATAHLRQQRWRWQGRRPPPPRTRRSGVSVRLSLHRWRAAAAPSDAPRCRSTAFRWARSRSRTFLSHMSTRTAWRRRT